MKQFVSIKRVLLIAAPIAIAGVAIASIMADRIKDEANRKNEAAMLNWFEMTSPTPRRLDSRFTDVDGDLVADAPKDPSRQVSPEMISFSYVAGPDAADELPAWKEFAEYLSKKLAVPVEATAFQTSQQQLNAVAEGRLHVTAFNTGAVPLAVSSCGFVPFCTMGQDDGSFGTTMHVIVPAKSPIKSIKELKGHTIAFTTRDSNSGCKSALAALREFDYLPLRDYMWKFSGSHDASIRGVAENQYEAAAVAGDLLARAISNGDVSDDRFRTIYESERFPPATFGYVQFLPKDMTDKICATFLEFQSEDTSLQPVFEAAGVKKFVPLSYKQDFALIRRIDDVFRTPNRASR
jgi:phosphonate transport system substrate-binding protein